MKNISFKQIFTLLLCNLFILMNIVGCANQEAETTKSETTSKSEIVTEVVTEKESETEAVKTEETQAEETQAEEIGETRILRKKLAKQEFSLTRQAVRLRFLIKLTRSPYRVL